MSEGPEGEDKKAYNAGVIMDLEKELVGSVDQEKLIKGPQWTRLLVGDLIRRIANLRALNAELSTKVERRLRGAGS